MNVDPTSVKHIGDYYYFIQHGQAGCTSDDSVVAKDNQYIKELRGANDEYSIEILPGGS
jgi:hypothetical protein